MSYIPSGCCVLNFSFTILVGSGAVVGVGEGEGEGDGDGLLQPDIVIVPIIKIDNKITNTLFIF
jgi:hypothetical protein